MRNSAKRSNVARGVVRGRGGARGAGGCGLQVMCAGRVAGGGASGGAGLERFAEVAFEALRPAAVAPISLSAGVSGVGAGFGSAALLPLSKSPTPADTGAKDSKNIEIAEVIVGAILGECCTLF